MAEEKVNEIEEYINDNYGIELDENNKSKLKYFKLNKNFLSLKNNKFSLNGLIDSIKDSSTEIYRSKLKNKLKDFLLNKSTSKDIKNEIIVNMITRKIDKFKSVEGTISGIEKEFICLPKLKNKNINIVPIENSNEIIEMIKDNIKDKDNNIFYDRYKNKDDKGIKKQLRDYGFMDYVNTKNKFFVELKSFDREFKNIEKDENPLITIHNGVDKINRALKLNENYNIYIAIVDKNNVMKEHKIVKNKNNEVIFSLYNIDLGNLKIPYNHFVDNIFMF